MDKEVQKHPGGRPKKYTPELIAEITAKLDKYINSTDIPILAEFAYLNNMNRQLFYDYVEFLDILKKYQAKREAGLEKLMLSGKAHVAAGCIFALKNMGWKDNPPDADKPTAIQINIMTTGKVEAVTGNE